MAWIIGNEFGIKKYENHTISFIIHKFKISLNMKEKRNTMNIDKDKVKDQDKDKEIF